MANQRWDFSEDSYLRDTFVNQHVWIVCPDETADNVGCYGRGTFHGGMNQVTKYTFFYEGVFLNYRRGIQRGFTYMERRFPKWFWCAGRLVRRE